MQLLKIAEAAALLRVHKRTLQTWRKVGYGPMPVKVGARVFYRPEDIENFLRDQYQAAELEWAQRQAAWVAALPEAEYQHQPGADQ